MTVNDNNSNPEKTAILLAVVFSTFITAFMGSSINLAIPAIGTEFNADVILLGWIVKVYLLVSTIFLVPFGRLGDIYGRKKVFLSGMIIITVSSLLSSLSFDIYSLLVFRIFQGIGSSMIFATAMAIVTSVFQIEERGKALGFIVASGYAGLSFGPFAGGLFTEYLGWRSIFVFPVLLGCMGICYVMRKIKSEWTEARDESFDLRGSILYGLALLLLMFGLTRIPGVWGFILLASGAGGLTLFVFYQLRNPSPVIQLDMFRKNKVFAFSNLATIINYSATFAIAFLLSLYLQYIKDYTPRDAGMILVSQPVIMALVSPLAGRLSDRIEPRILATVGMAITTIGLFCLIFVDNMNIRGIILTLILIGIGFGFFSSPNNNAIMSSVHKRHYGVASGTMGTMRLLGQTFSMGIVMLVFSLLFGRELFTEGKTQDFLLTVQVAFILLSAICFFGIFVSYARGNIHSS